MNDTTDQAGTRTVQLTIEMVGQLKRSTFQREPPEPTEELLSDLFHWSYTVRRQASRLAEDVRGETRAWNLKSRLGLRRHFSATSADEHLLLVAAANLERALQRVSKRLRRRLHISKDSRRALWLLRNIYEHWDSLRQHMRDGTPDPEGTLEKLRAEYPKAEPWSITIGPDKDDIVLADAVAVRPLFEELRRLEARVIRLQRARKPAEAGPLVEIAEAGQD